MTNHNQMSQIYSKFGRAGFNLSTSAGCCLTGGMRSLLTPHQGAACVPAPCAYV
jgi:hypothetical protein